MGKQIMQSFHVFLKNKSQFMAAFWSIMIIICETSIALYIIRNI